MKIYIVYDDSFCIMGIFRTYGNALKRYHELIKNIPRESSCYFIQEYVTED